jgi:sugar lactone lactonase YvrE
LGIAVDGSYVYWTERDSGKVRRVAKTGGTILDLVPTQVNYLADSIAVDGEHVYWADTTGTPGTARLRRVPKNGGAVENLVLGRSGLHGINLLANYVYWGDWDGVWRLQVGPFEVHLPLIARQYQD